jgi:hypothetical protein
LRFVRVGSFAEIDISQETAIKRLNRVGLPTFSGYFLAQTSGYPELPAVQFGLLPL